jgi:hypothetical protein
MNRLSPLITRRGRPTSAAAAMPVRGGFPRFDGRPASADDLRHFATSFAAGLVFFGTYLA